MNPTVSIIIPSFNKERFLCETLDSILNQSYTDWEALIIDDGSTDDSVATIQEYRQNDTRFKFFQREREPKGGSTCRNIGLQRAIGDYIIFLDTDDLLLPSTLENRLKLFTKHQEMDFLVFPMGTFIQEIGDSDFVWRPRSDKHLQRFLSHEIQWTITSPIWKRDRLERLGGFDESFPRLQDVELHTRALLDNNTIYKVFPQLPPDSFYRIDEERIVGSYELFIERLHRGTLLYLEKMMRLLESDRYLARYLKGTLISTINQILYSFKQNKITHKQKDDTIERLIESADSLGILSPKDKLLLQLYIVGYEANLYKLKGFSYIMKRLIIL